MTRHLHDRPRFALANIVAVLFLGAVSYGAMPQARKAAPKPTPPPSGDLQQQVTALQRQLQQLQQHLDLLEQARKAGDAVAGQAPAEETLTTIKAPFTVVDRSNRVIVRIQDADGSRGRGVYVYDSSADKPIAHMGVLAKGGGGRVYVANAKSSRPEAQMAADPENPFIELNRPGADSRLVLIDKQGVSIVNSKNVIAANIGLIEDRGALELDDAAGMKMVEAASLRNGKGIVQANPARVMMSIEGNPSVLMGGNKK